MKKSSMTSLIACIFFTAISFQFTTAQTWNLVGNADATTNSRLGTRFNVPLKFYTNNLQRMIIDSLGNVGINTLKPVNLLTVQLPGGSEPATSWLAGGSLPVFMGFGEEKSTGFNLATAGNFATLRPVFNTRRARGTLSSPLVVSNNDYLASIVSSGFDGSVFQNPAAIDFYVDGIPTAGSVPGRISFVTGSNTANRLERLKIGSSGDVSVVTGNLIMSSAQKTIQFAAPDVSSAAMLTMFPAISRIQYPDRMVISHSAAFSTWGLQYQDASDKFNFLSNGSPVLTADLGTQKVGIGTSVPTLAKLVVEGMTGNTVAVFRGSPGGKGISLASDFPGVYFNMYYNGQGRAMAPGYAGIVNFDPDKGNLYLGTTPAAAANAGDATPIVSTLLLSKEGNVSIGKYLTAPAARLDVVADAAAVTPVISARTTYAGTSQVRGISSSAVPADGYGYGIEASGGSRGGHFLGFGGSYSGSVYGAFCSALGTAGTHYGVYATASGGDENWGGYFPTKTYTNELRVGGTKGATGYAASINGKLIAEEIRVELKSNWPDYVFKKDYKLMSLEKLEAMVSSESHLPGIPAAAAVKDGGIMLGEMQTKTIEKLEESTLYIIQLNNKIKLLEKQKQDEFTKFNNKLMLLEKRIESLAKRTK